MNFIIRQLSSTKQAFRILLIPVVGVLFICIRNFVIHPYYNKSNISYAKKSLSENKGIFKILMDHAATVAKEDSDFYMEHGTKHDEILWVLDSVKVKEGRWGTDRYSKKENYYVSIDIRHLLDELDIQYLGFHYKEGVPFVRLYVGRFNYSVSDKKISLYYFPNRYQSGFFENDKELLLAWKEDRNKDWLYLIDSNWVLKSKKTPSN